MKSTKEIIEQMEEALESKKKRTEKQKKERKKESKQTCFSQCLHINSYIITLCMNIIHLNHPPLNMHHQKSIYMLMPTEYSTEKKRLTSKKKVLITFPMILA